MPEGDSIRRYCLQPRFFEKMTDLDRLTSFDRIVVDAAGEYFDRDRDRGGIIF
jgi:hypothetical protein